METRPVTTALQTLAAVCGLALALALAPPAAEAQLAWTKATDSGPSPRMTEGRGIAFDSRRGVIVLFGGTGDEGLLGDTWEWDGARWRRVSRSGPSPRTGAAMAYDGARGVTVLHGGCECEGTLMFDRTDTWEWNGRRWRQVADDGPRSISPHAVYDRERRVVLLYAAEKVETWEWDGEAWTRVATTGPEPRTGVGLAYDSERGVAVLHSGALLDDQGTRDTWEWNGEGWTRVDRRGPPFRRQAAATYDSRRGVVVYQGGWVREEPSNPFGAPAPRVFYDDVWEWDGSRWRQSVPAGAPQRARHSIVYDEARGEVLAVGGMVSANDGGPLIELVVGTWLLRAPLPGSRSDFDGDGSVDPAVFRPAGSRWTIHPDRRVRFGARNAIPVAGDYDGDGTTDVAYFQAATGTWRVRKQFELSGFGQPGDLPVPADYDGDGAIDAAIFRPAEGRWELASGAVLAAAAARGLRGEPYAADMPLTVLAFGQAGDVPVPADYDGDGVAEPAVYRPSTRQFIVHGGARKRLGKSGDLPVPADYDGDGAVDFAVWRPKTGGWKVLGGASGKHGELGQIPVPGDYDGDGRADFAAYDPITGVWSVDGQFELEHGGPGELPVVR